MRKKIFSLILLLLCCNLLHSQSFSFTPDQKKAIDRVEAAKEMAQASNQEVDWLDAIEELNKAIQLIPEYFIFYYDVADIYEFLNDYSNAIKYYQEYLKYDADSQTATDIQSKINKLEYKLDRNIVLNERFNALFSEWKSDLSDEKGKALWILTFEEFDNNIRVTVSPESALYNKNYTYPTAIVKKNEKNIKFMFTTDKSIDPEKYITSATSIIDIGGNITSSYVPIVGSYIGSASQLISSIPINSKEENVQFIFDLMIVDNNTIKGAYNMLKYISKNKSNDYKTIKDEVLKVVFKKPTNVNTQSNTVNNTAIPSTHVELNPVISKSLTQTINKPQNINNQSNPIEKSDTDSQQVGSGNITNCYFPAVPGSFKSYKSTSYIQKPSDNEPKLDMEYTFSEIISNNSQQIGKSKYFQVEINYSIYELNKSKNELWVSCETNALFSIVKTPNGQTIYDTLRLDKEILIPDEIKEWCENKSDISKSYTKITKKTIINADTSISYDNKTYSNATLIKLQSTNSYNDELLNINAPKLTVYSYYIKDLGLIYYYSIKETKKYVYIRETKLIDHKSNYNY